MIENINRLEKILQRFKFNQPVPSDVQRQILSFKRKTTVDVLKSFGEYNVFYGQVLRFYFFTKRIGINLTARQSEIFISIITTILSLAGILIIAGFINSRLNTTVINKEDILSEEVQISIEKPVEKAQKVQIKKETIIINRLGITQILSDEENEEFASIITNKLYSRIKSQNKAGTVIFRKTDGADKSINKLLTGRLNKIGGTYLLSISIANLETGKLLYDKNYSFKETDEADEIINKAAENINSIKEIW